MERGRGMTYTQLSDILNNPSKYDKIDQKIAAKKLLIITHKTIHFLAALEILKEMVKLFIKILFFYGGTAITIVSFIVLAAICTTEADVTTKTIVIEEFMLVVGIIMAYIGHMSLEEERGKKNDKRKARK